MSIESELLAIKGDRDILPIDDAIRWAKANPTSDLHRRYDWDVQEAAWEHWRQQTRQLFNECRLKIENADTYYSIRRFVSLSIDRVAGGGYRDIDQVRLIPELRTVLLEDALKELQRVEEKYKHLVELAKVWEEVGRVKRRRGRPRLDAPEARP